MAVTVWPGVEQPAGAGGSDTQTVAVRRVPVPAGGRSISAANGRNHAFVADFDRAKPAFGGGAAGARNGSQRSQTALDPARPARTVRAGEWLPDRPAPTVPDLSELDGMQKVRGSNPRSSTYSRFARSGACLGSWRVQLGLPATPCPSGAHQLIIAGQGRSSLFDVTFCVSSSRSAPKPPVNREFPQQVADGSQSGSQAGMWRQVCAARRQPNY